MAMLKLLTFNAMSTDTPFGPWLQQRREERGISQSAVAKKAGITVTHLSRIENGQSGVKRRTLVHIVDAINELEPDQSLSLDHVLIRAGFAPILDLVDLDEDVRISFRDSEDWDDERRRRAIEAFKTVLEGIKARDREAQEDRDS